MERTFVLLKPSAIVRGLIGEVLSRFERKGIKIVAMKMIKVKEEEAKKLYEVHKKQPFFVGLVKYIVSAPVVVIVVEGRDVVQVVRNLVGSTDPREAHSGTIRGDFSMSITNNIVHAADSRENARKELRIFFGKEKLLSYERSDFEWI